MVPPISYFGLEKADNAGKGASHQRRARRDLNSPLRFLTKNPDFLGLGITWVHTEVLERIFSLLHFFCLFWPFCG